MKLIHTVKGDQFYFGYDVKLSTCRSDGIAWLLIVIMYIQRLFLRFKTAPTQSVICDQKMSCRKLVNFVKVTKQIIRMVVWLSLRFTTFCETVARIIVLTNYGWHTNSGWLTNYGRWERYNLETRSKFTKAKETYWWCQGQVTSDLTYIYIPWQTISEVISHDGYMMCYYWGMEPSVEIWQNRKMRSRSSEMSLVGIYTEGWMFSSTIYS